MRFKLISCQVFCREIAAAVKLSPHEIHIAFLSKGLHEIPCTEMCRRIQQNVDAASADAFDAILLAYGFCNHGIAGLTARGVPLVVPKAHDCISVLMGPAKSAAYRDANPGTYFQSSGWIEHRQNPAELEALSSAKRNSLYATRAELAQRYGEENADYLHERLGGHTRHYSHLAYIRSSTSAVDDRYAAQTAAEAAQRGWTCDEIPGDLSLLQRLVSGDWPEEAFLIVPPGHAVAASYDHRIIRTESITP